jgi:hypothetical protein
MGGLTGKFIQRSDPFDEETLLLYVFESLCSSTIKDYTNSSY